MSVVLVAGGESGIMARYVAHLARQTIASRIELVIVTGWPDSTRVAEEHAAALHSVRIEGAGLERRVGELRAQGVRCAAADYVMLAEDHCFPRADVAELLLAELEGGADVAGPRIACCNPALAASWTGYLAAYEPWIGEGETRNYPFLAGHNSAYRRAVLVEQGDRLGSFLTAEPALHWKLGDEGKRLRFVPAAVTRHVNQTGLHLLAWAMLRHARNFGHNRAMTSGTLKKWVYVVASPLIPLVRLRRSVGPVMKHVPAGVSKARVLMNLAYVYAAASLGEAWGMLRGPGSAELADWDIELDRTRYSVPAEMFLMSERTEARDEDAMPERRREPVRVGVIGCGAIAEQVHLPNLNERGDAEVVAIADPVDEARERAGAVVPGARRYAEVAELLADEAVEAVVIASPSAYHADAAVAAFEAGKHVYLEKPIAMTVADGRRVDAAWRASGKVGMVGFNYRCRPDTVAARRRVVRGDLGAITMVRSTFTRAAGRTGGWRKGGDARGVLLDFASHEMDLAAFVLAEPVEGRSVSGWSAAFEADSATLTGRSASGVAVECFVSFSAVDEARLEVFGQRGKLTLDRYGGLTCAVRGAEAVGPIGKVAAAVRNAVRVDRLLARRGAAWGDPAFAMCLGRFIDGVRFGYAPRPDVGDGLASLAAIEGALEGSAGAGPAGRGAA